MGDDVRLKCLLKQNLVVTVVNISLQDLRHHIREVPEEHAEIVPKKTSSHIKSLLAVIVTIIFIYES